MSNPNSRKRGAPGASPVVPMQQRTHQQYGTDNMVNDAALRWNGDGDSTGFIDDGSFGASNFGFMQTPQQPYAQAGMPPSNTVARRPLNNALVQSNPLPAFDDTDWAKFGDDSSLIQQGVVDGTAEQDSIEKLEEMAQKAKREAQEKRKQIPPFVQKLRSFLEDPKNEEFIRWSENGDSFIVLDEDEFAKRLIPELFKHNNYASFVRQLNMYGFHKCVGLSYNSMRASERKNKSPSEYANPYFRRDHPNLLWLINKPKSGSKTKKGGKAAGGEADSDDEGVVHEESIPNQVGNSTSHQANRSLPAATDQGTLPKKEITVIREELQRVREQQKLILGAINRLQRNNNDLYNQALMFQNQHDRHQNSINAILNFLANVFRKTLEDQSSTQNVSDIISSMLTNQGQQQGTQHGSVVDLGDFFQTQMDHAGNIGGPSGKRTRGLLPPIPDQPSGGSPASRSPSVGKQYQHMNSPNPEMGHVTELLDASPPDTQSPSLRQELETNPQERMMKIINDHNATNSSGLDLPGAAEYVANTPNTLNNDQRSQLVNFMAGQNSPLLGPANAHRSRTTPSNQPSPRAAPSPSNDKSAAPSLSPIMRSPTMPAPSLNRINANQEELSQLQQLQSEQDAKISELGELLGPLSPSGRIPGLDDPQAYFDQPNVDLDQYFNSDAFLNDPSFGAVGHDGEDFNFNLDPGGTSNILDDSQFQQSRADKDTPSSTGTEEIQRDDLAENSTQDRGTKRQRTR